MPCISRDRHADQDLEDHLRRTCAVEILDIDFPPGTGASAPTKVELDFDELLECGPGDPLVDPHSIRVKRRLDRIIRRAIRHG